MSKTFVIADLHGRLDLLLTALDKIESMSPDKIIFTGDFIDRGPESKEVVDRLLEGGSCPWSFVRGNHEDMALHCADGTDLAWWLSNGGYQTIQSYGGGGVSKEHLDWFASLPRLTWDKYRVYTHAGVSESYSLQEQPENVTQWHRYAKGEDVGYKDKHVVHGHTPIGPELYKNRTNLDAGSCFNGKLCVGIFEDATEGGPVDLIEIDLGN